MNKCFVCDKACKKDFVWNEKYACSENCLDKLKTFCMEYNLLEI